MLPLVEFLLERTFLKACTSTWSRLCSKNLLLYLRSFVPFSEKIYSSVFWKCPRDIWKYRERHILCLRMIWHFIMQAPRPSNFSQEPTFSKKLYCGFTTIHFSQSFLSLQLLLNISERISNIFFNIAKS